MKKPQVDHQPAPPFAPTAMTVLTKVANNLRQAGAMLPIKATTEAPTPESSHMRGLSLALLIVEGDLDALAAAAPRDNLAHRALFMLPPIQASTSNAVAAPDLPAQKIVTGDAEVDAVLWLREVISTGQADLIEKARLAAARIKTPLKEIEKRYAAHVRRAHPGNWAESMKTIGFADLDELADRAIKKAVRQHEARARFGDAIFEDTPAEQFCHKTLKGLKSGSRRWDLDKQLVDQRFDAAPDQRPGTLTDCVLELTYWDDLYWLRNAVSDWDHSAQTSARDDYVFRCLARIPPRDPQEATAVLRYLAGNDGMDRAQARSILLNLVGAPEPYRAQEAGGDDA